MQNVVLTADKVEFLCRWVHSFALHEVLTSTGHQVSKYNRVLLAIPVSILPVDSTFTINNLHQNPARLSWKPQKLTSELQLKNHETFTPQNFLRLW